MLLLLLGFILPLMVRIELVLLLCVSCVLLVVLVVLLGLMFGANG